MARRLLANDKYLESLHDSMEVAVYTTTTVGQTCFVIAGSDASVTIVHTLSTNYPVVTLVDANGVLKSPSSVQYTTGQVVVHINSSLVPASVIWHCRLS